MNWPDFAKRLLLADGRISDLEADLLRRAVREDGADRELVEFLADLKREAVSVHPRFDDLFFRLVRRLVLADGTIRDAEARWLRKVIFADNEVTPAEAKFIKELKAGAQVYGDEFDRLVRDCTRLDSAEFLG